MCDEKQTSAWLECVAAPLLLVQREPLLAIFANAQARRLFGPWLHQPTSAIEAFAGKVGAQSLAAALDGGQTTVVTCQLARGIRPVLFQPTAVPDREHVWLVTLSEADEEHASAGWKSSLEDILDLLPVGVEIYDKDMNALFYNRSADELFLYDETPIFNQIDWFDFGFPDPFERKARLEEWFQRVEVARRDPTSIHQIEWSMRCRDGRDHVVQFLFRFVGDHFIMVLWDVSEQRALEKELFCLARTDPLTGIGNRRDFMEAGEAAFAAARASQSDLAALVVDIDHFKSVNDRHGHTVGDAAIHGVAERCRSVLRARDRIGRLGGEEFAILLPGAGRREAREIAQQILSAVSRAPLRAGADELHLGVSIGATVITGADDAFSAMLARADRALYEAKDAGRGRVIYRAHG